VLGHSFDAVPEAHLFANALHVRPHGFDADPQLVADLLVDVAGGQQIENLQLARRQVL